MFVNSLLISQCWYASEGGQLWPLDHGASETLSRKIEGFARF